MGCTVFAGFQQREVLCFGVPGPVSGASTIWSQVSGLIWESGPLTTVVCSCPNLLPPAHPNPTPNPLSLLLLQIPFRLNCWTGDCQSSVPVLILCPLDLWPLSNPICFENSVLTDPAEPGSSPISIPPFHCLDACIGTSPVTCSKPRGPLGDWSDRPSGISLEGETFWRPSRFCCTKLQG